MWIVIKFRRNNLKFTKDNLKKAFGKSIVFYTPKLKYQKIKKCKRVFFEKYLLEDYLLCYSNKFEENFSINKIKYLKGVKYVLEKYKENQKNIIQFIQMCKKNENQEGYICQTFFDFSKNKFGKFLNGPFAEMVFNIISDHKFKLKIMIGNMTTTIKKDSNLLYCPL